MSVCQLLPSFHVFSSIIPSSGEDDSWLMNMFGYGKTQARRTFSLKFLRVGSWQQGPLRSTTTLETHLFSMHGFVSGVFFLYFTSCRIVGDLYILLVNILYCWFPTKKPIFGAYSFFGGGQIGQIDQQWYGLTWTSYLSHEQNASLDWLIMVDWLGINRLTG